MSGYIESNGRQDSERKRLISQDISQDKIGENPDRNENLQGALVNALHKQPLTKEYVVYRERWYILGIFSALALLFLCNWNTWGPIADTASKVLHWGPAQFALLENWGPFTFIPSAFFFSWLLHAKGLRVSVLLSGGFLLIGCGIRCIPAPISKMEWTMNLGHIFIGLSGPVSMGGVTTVSATWFPMNERTTATALLATTPYLGLAASFVIGPAIVKEIHSPTTGSPLTTPGRNFSDLPDQYVIDDDYADDVIEKHLQEIRTLMYVEFGLVAVVYLAALIRFPARPPTPPTASAVIKREDMKAGIIALVKKISFWIPAISYACITGVFYGWIAQLGTIFSNKVSQTTTGWIGFYANIASLVGGALSGRCADYFTGKMKPILLLLITAASIALTWAILLANDYIPFNLASLYIAIILFGLLLNSTVPLFLEITVEGVFPIGEETTTIFMTWLNNFTSLCFLILPMIPSIVDFAWLNWVMLGSVVICIPLMIFYKEHYNRIHYDESHPLDDSNMQEN